MHIIKITPNLLFEYQCTSGKFIRLPNRIESKLFCPNWNALVPIKLECVQSVLRAPYSPLLEWTDSLLKDRESRWLVSCSHIVRKIEQHLSWKYNTATVYRLVYRLWPYFLMNCARNNELPRSSAKFSRRRTQAGCICAKHSIIQQHSLHTSLRVV